LRSLSIVIPAYNEERRLPGTLERIRAHVGGPGYDAEIIVVDDGSRDGTLKTVRKLRDSMPFLRDVSYGANRGKGYAVRAGVAAATKDAILFSDADLSTPIEDLEKLWGWYGRGWDVVIASRALPGSLREKRQPLYRELMGDVFRWLVSLLVVRGFRDTQCGFKLFRASAARRIFERVRTDGFAFDVEVLMRARELGYRTAEVPVVWRDSPASRVRPVRDSARMLLDLLRMRGLG
jgi:dolichyl-phosphate beta-glucosyltransferase